MSDALVEKVHRLVDDGRIYVKGDTAWVAGDTRWHKVTATTAGVECDCDAAMAGQVCSHILAAQVKWAAA